MANQYSGEFDIHEERMKNYISLVRNLAEQFDKFELTWIPRGENTAVDALAALASTSDPNLKMAIPVESIDSPSITLEVNFIAIERED